MKNVQLQQKKIPTLQEIVSQTDETVKENELQVLLNIDPPKDWIKTNALANNSLYIPIDKIEYLLTRLFIKWHVEVISYTIIANSVAVHIRLYYTSPITGETLHQDGLGASPLQTNKDASATDWTQIKNSAVQMALPAAETYAIKDAAEKIGRIFGKDLNRKDLINYAALSGRYNSDKDVNLAIEKINLCKSRDEAMDFYNKLPEILKSNQDIINAKNQF